MTFGEKIKKLRADNNLTQEQLAEKIFVTRTAISKWETDRGYPSVDSLKELADIFQISIDELISDKDVENKKLPDTQRARKMYFVAIACLAVTVVSTVAAYFLKIYYFNIAAVAGVIAYIIFGFLSKPKFKRINARKLIVPYLISRVVIFAVVIAVAVYTVVKII